MRPAQLATILDREFLSARDGHHTPVMLWGPPGVGKSQIIAQVAARHGVPMIDIRLSQMEPTDLRGIPFRIEDRVEWAIPSMLPDAERHGPHGILFLDEITSAPPSVSAAAYQLILDRRLGEYEVPAGWAIFAAGNRQGDRGVTYAMPAPLANRFSHFEVEANLDDWVAWAYANDIDERADRLPALPPRTAVRFRPGAQPGRLPQPALVGICPPRAAEIRRPPGAAAADPAGLRRPGRRAGTATPSSTTWTSMPDLDAILRGEAVAVPREVDLQYAVAAALVGRAIRAKGSADAAVIHGHILDYASRFPLREMGIMLVSDMHRAVGQSLFAVPQFSEMGQCGGRSDAVRA